MRDHDWRVEEVDGGPLGTGEFWKCAGCGLSGGFVLPSSMRRWKPFLAGHPDVPFPAEDCDAAKEAVAAYRASPEYRQRLFDWQLGDAWRVLHLLEESHGVGGAVDRKTGRVNGRKSHRRFLAEPRAPEDGHRVTLTRKGVRETVEVGQWELQDLLTRFFDEPET